MHKLLDYVCKELEDLERKADKDGKLSMAEIEYVDKLAHIKKSILTSDAMMGEGEYSSRDNSYRGSYRRDYMGRYSRERSYGNGYSMAEDDFKDELRDLMQSAPNEQIRMKLQRMMSEV